MIGRGRLATRAVFAARIWSNAIWAAAIVVGALVVGDVGYMYYGGMGPAQAFANASMILSGMGPLWSPRSDGGKVFAGVYALYSGLAVLAIAGVTFAPLVHRLLHSFHADETDTEERKEKRKSP